MDEGKVTAVLNCPKPTTVKELQHFLGFSNYYCRFFWSSSTTAPLSVLTSQKSRTFQWTNTALPAFETLKSLFTSAPILTQPVDASEVDVGAVLSQWVGTPPKLHTWLLFQETITR
jgi:hypothetical protein